MLTLRALHRSVGSHHIINGIDLDIPAGQAVGLVGPNGCGKTSLINLINGFNTASSGTISLDHHRLDHLSVEQRTLLGVGRVFQHPGIFKNLTIYDNLALAFASQLTWWQKLLPLTALDAEKQDRISAVLHDLDLYDKRHKLAGSLSGGQMRLLEIGRLSLQDTTIFLLDEPTAGVSPKLKGKVVELLKKIIATGKTVIIVEHDFAFLGSFVDRIIVMQDGQVIVDGSYDEIKQSEKVREIYFG